MGTKAVLVKNADRLMTSVAPTERGLMVTFADGKSGLIPFGQIPEIKGLSDLAQVELPNPYEIVLVTSDEETVSLPWDFARHYCDASYRPRVEAIAASIRQSIGERIRLLRKHRGLTQQALANLAGIGRATLVRTENGEYLPRFSTLNALARALDIGPQDLLSDEAYGPDRPPSQNPKRPGR